MTDIEIIDLYWGRSESAISETARQYGAYCRAISMNIVHNNNDAEECVNDTYLNAWNNIPPQRPAMLGTFLGRITRNLSLDRYKSRKAQKRIIDETGVLLSELDECVPAGNSVEDEFEVKHISEAIDNFLSVIGRDDRMFFVRRYWYGDSIANIALRFTVSESKIKTNLFRTRNKLKDYLEKEGVTI